MGSAEELSVHELCRARDRCELWTSFIKRSGARRVAEIGVMRGVFADAMLGACPCIDPYFMIDPWRQLDGWNKPANVDNDSFAQCHDEAIRKTQWASSRRLGERFVAPGGGFVNLDYYRRAVDSSDMLVVLLGEGTFHQFHGGVATNSRAAVHPSLSFAAEYRSLRGCEYARPQREAVLLGSCPPQALPWLARSVELAGSAGAG